ncbi:AcrR family transcriptional regulator [Bradyrhizobium sp. AZCC 2262]|uniref:TetR/AcrR family transcriptional regulator n=1 Tax=Bradyrhizobium sp. AZCC 2262 TaxID=3117022 RepID=UPI002FF2DA5E
MIAQSERRIATVKAILDAARGLFASRGFAETSVDAIAVEAGVAKGAVYHHFSSKEEVLDRLVDAIQSEIAVEVRKAARKGKTLADSFARGIYKYLTAAVAPDAKRILFVDGPAILGWERWRAIDNAHFSTLTRGALEARLQERLSEAQAKAIGHLVAGSLLEAALVCAAADRPERAARDMTDGLVVMLTPLLA